MQDEATVVNGLAAAFQAACSASSTKRLCHLLPLELTVAPVPQDHDPAASPPQTALLSGMVVQPAAPLKLTQLNRMRVLESMLSARLMRPAASEGSAGDEFRSGVLSIEQSRALVPLLHGDPMVCPRLCFVSLNGIKSYSLRDLACCITCLPFSGCTVHAARREMAVPVSVMAWSAMHVPALSTADRSAFDCSRVGAGRQGSSRGHLGLWRHDHVAPVYGGSSNGVPCMRCKAPMQDTCSRRVVPRARLPLWHRQPAARALRGPCGGAARPAAPPPLHLAGGPGRGETGSTQRRCRSKQHPISAVRI